MLVETKLDLVKEIQVVDFNFILSIYFIVKNLFTGGGFYVKIHGFWTLRGIVSLGLTKTSGDCDVSTFALYTNLIDFAEWIKSIAEPAERLLIDERMSGVTEKKSTSRIFFPGDPELDGI